MARSVGIPARLATGFVPGNRDSLTGQFVVREHDAHAWAEIYFPGVGWQPFDPTADGAARGRREPRADRGCSRPVTTRSSSVCSRLRLVLAVVAAPELLARLAPAPRPAALELGAATAHRLERIGRTRRAGPDAVGDAARVRRGAGRSTWTTSASRAVGETLDADGFSASGASPSARADADAVLSSL